MSDPTRLVDGGDGPQELAELVAAARADLPSKAQLASVAASTPGLAAGTAAAGAIGGPKVVFGLVVACGLSAAGIYGLAKSAAPLQVERSAAPIVVAAPNAAVQPPPIETSDTIEEAPAVTTTAVTPRAPAAATAAPPGPSETELLGRARAALRNDPSRALALAREHARRFPKGALAQEREVILIEALERSGDGAEASRRAEAFGKQYPSSAHAPKIKALTQSP